MWPPDDELLAAWRLLVADPDTAGAFCALVLPPLEADLTRSSPTRDPADISTAADDAVLAFLRRPAAFDPLRCPLPAFLRFVAGRDLINLRDREQRHHRGRIPWAGVELTHPAGNEWEEGKRLADHPNVRAAVAALADADRRVYALMCEGARDTAVFAAELGLADRPADEQTEAVKRTKDRIKARLKRAAGEP